jgi:hypothetical protein
VNKQQSFFESTCYEQITKRLNINFDELNSPEDQTIRLHKSMLNQEAMLYSQIDTILNSSVSLEEKQKKLEQYSYESQNYQVNTQYYVPSILIPYILKLDQYFLKKSALQSDDLRYFLPSSLTEFFNYETNLNSKLTQKQGEVIKKLKNILQLFQYNNQSFGLFLLYNLVYRVRKEWQKKGTIDSEIAKEVVLHHVSSDQKDFISLETPYVSLVSFFGESLLLNYEQLGKLVLSKLEGKMAHQESSSLDSLTKQEQFLFQILSETQFDSDDPVIERELGIYCLLILEILGMIQDKLVTVEAGQKTPRLAGLNPKFGDVILSIPANPRKLPMLVQPNYWEFEQGSTNLNYGGYLYNSKLNYPGVVNRHKKGIATFSPYELEAINYLQSNYYKVNTELLKVVEQNAKESILQYLKEIPRSDLFFHLSDSDDRLRVKNIDGFLNSDSGYSALVEKLKDHEDKIPKGLKSELDDTRKRLKAEYDVLFNLLLQFIHAYLLYLLFSDYKLYFCIFLDARGRLYYSGSGGAFGLQAGGFGKHLLELQGNEEIPNQVMNYIDPKSLIYTTYRDQLDKQKGYFEFLKYDKGVPVITIGKDASCSGTSIICGLIGDRTGILFTNILYDTREGIPRAKKDIYVYYGEHLKLTYPKTFSDLKPYLRDYSNFQKSLSKKYKVSESDLIERIEVVLKNIEKDVFRRSTLKSLVMCKNYSQSDRGRAKMFRNVSNFFVTNPFFISKVDEYICIALGKWAGKQFEICFPKVSEFCKLLLRRIDHSKPVTLVSGVCKTDSGVKPDPIALNGEMQYEQPQEELITSRFPNLDNSSKPRKLNYSITTNKICKVTARRSLIANFIHYLDSRLCLSVIFLCKQEKICVWTNHDCFYTHPFYETKLKEAYFQAYKTLLLDHDLIERFLLVNNSTLKKADERLLERFKNSRLKILKDIEKGHLKRSPFCLS